MNSRVGFDCRYWIWFGWIVGNLAWIGVNLLGEFNISMVLMYVAYLGINIKGFIDWSKQEKT